MESKDILKCLGSERPIYNHPYSCQIWWEILTSRALLQQIATQNASYVMVTARMVRIKASVCVRGGHVRKLVRNS